MLPLGAKTGVDFKKYKNTVGSFYPADTLLIWPGALETLSQKEYVSGLAESLKAALLMDAELWMLFREKREAVLDREPEVLKEILIRSLAVKGRIVEEDMRESGVRAHLNLGHTFGHALETVTNFGLMTHGEAVLLGDWQGHGYRGPPGVYQRKLRPRSKRNLGSLWFFLKNTEDYSRIIDKRHGKGQKEKIRYCPVCPPARTSGYLSDPCR
jgi:hypothetical protein